MRCYASTVYAVIVCLSVASRLVSLIVIPGCSSVGHSTTYSLPRLIDHNQIWYAGTYLSSCVQAFLDPLSPILWVPEGKICKISPISKFKGLPFGHYGTNQKSRCESMRMSMESIVPKY